MCNFSVNLNLNNLFKNRHLFKKICLHTLYVLFVVVDIIQGLKILFYYEYMTRNEYVIESVVYYWPFYSCIHLILAQTGFLLLALSHDALEWTDRENSSIGRKIRYFRDVLFLGIVVPYTCFVFAMFWVLYAIDRELVFPAVYDEVIPWWFNQCVHTNILVLVVAEHLLQARRRPTDEKWELIINAALGIAYAIVYYSIYFFANRWLYNVFGIMTWWQVCLFQIMIWTSSYVFYRIQFPLNRLIHGPEPEIEKTVQISPESNGKSNGDVIEEDNAKNGDFTTKNGDFTTKNGDFTTKNGDFTTKNGDFTTKNGDFTTKNGDFTTENGKTNKAFDGDDIDSKLPFSSKSWSLKYRNMRQSENTNL